MESEAKCSVCGVNAAVEPHACPYACQIDNDCSDNFCTCCTECEEACEENI